MLNKGKYLNARMKKLLLTYRLQNKIIQLPVSDLRGRMKWKWCLSSSTGWQGLSRQCCCGNHCALQQRALSLQKSLNYLSWLLFTTSGNTIMRQERLRFCSKILNKMAKKVPLKIFKTPSFQLFFYASEIKRKDGSPVATPRCLRARI